MLSCLLAIAGKKAVVAPDSGQTATRAEVEHMLKCVRERRLRENHEENVRRFKRDGLRAVFVVEHDIEEVERQLVSKLNSVYKVGNKNSYV